MKKIFRTQFDHSSYSYFSLGLVLTLTATLLVSIFAVPYQLRRRVKSSPVRAAGNSWYVATNGSPSGNGSYSSPWDLQTGLNGGVTANPADSTTHRVKPGDTLWLRGGTYFVQQGSYKGRYTSYLKGNSASPIIVRGSSGERAIIDGGITANGAYTYFWGFEITNTNPRDVGSQGGPWPPRFTRGSAITFAGPGHKAINMVIYNSGHPGISSTTTSLYSEIYGSIFWGVGNYDHDYNTPGVVTPRGSAWYTQSNGEPRLISDNISFRNIRTGGKSYGDVAPANGFTYDGNVSFSNGDDQLSIDSINNDVTSLTFINNYTYRRANDPHGTGTTFGLWVSGSRRNRGLIMRNNYFVNNTRSDLGSASWKNFIGATISNNTIVSRGAAAEWWAATVPVTVTWTGNKFYTPNPSSSGFIFLDPHTTSNHSPYIHNTGFSQWANSVGASSGGNTAVAGVPTQNSVFVRRNKYEPCRGNIVVYNWLRNSSVSVDISGAGIVAPGHRYKVIDAQNYFGPAVVQGTYNGGSITLPMNLSAVSPMPGVTDVPNIHTASGTNEFAVFVIFDTDTSATGCSAGIGTITPTPTVPSGTTPTPTSRPSPTPTPVSGGTTLTLNPLADTQIKSSTPSTNYGSAATLIVDTTPDPIEKAYLKFDLASLAGKSIVSAKLRFYITNGSAATQSLKGVANSGWTEGGLTYDSSSAYPLDTGAFATITASGTNVWKEVTITGYLRGKEGRVVSFGIDTANTDGIVFHSKENTNKPQLVITYSNATPTPTRRPTNTPTPRPTATPTPVLINILNNGNFEDGTASWNFSQGDAQAAFTTTTSNPYGGSGRSGQITITRPGNSPQLYQKGFSLTRGARYRLTFAARSNTGHDMRVHILKHTSPYTNLGLNRLIYLTSSWKTFSVDFTATNFAGTITDTRFRFWPGPYDAANDQFFVDNVVLGKL